MSKRWYILGSLAAGISGLILPQNITAYFTANATNRVSGFSGDWRSSQIQVAVVSPTQEYQLMGADAPPDAKFSERQLWQLQAPLQVAVLPGIEEPQLMFWCGDKLIWATKSAEDILGHTQAFFLPLIDCQTNDNLRVELTTSVDLVPVAHTTQMVWLAPEDRLKFSTTEVSATIYVRQSCKAAINWWQIDQLVLFAHEFDTACPLEYWSVDQAGNQSEAHELWVVLPPEHLPESPQLKDISVQDKSIYIRIDTPETTDFVSWLITGEKKLTQELLIMNWHALSLNFASPNLVPINLSGDTILQVERTEDLEAMEIRRLDLYGRLSIPLRYQLE